MNKFLLCIFFLSLFCLETFAQQTVGLFSNTPESFDGYTLFAPIPYTDTYLINNCGEKGHSWASTHGPALSVYLLEDGTLLRTGRIQGMGGDAFVEMIDWDGNVIWSYSPTATHGRYHHDIELLPNGNILMLVRDPKTQAELDSVGGTTTRSTINSEQVIEIQPDTVNGGATVVWEWKAWDHLIQDVDTMKPNYGVVGQHPERININAVSHESGNWLYTNGIDYNENFDQIIISARTYNEFWIIDHSTTTSEAADSTSGKYGKGGDLLYRWGNPAAYDQGTSADRKLFLQHDAHWIPDSLNDAGKIILYNNQNRTSQEVQFGLEKL